MYGIYDFIGLAGAALIILAFLLLQMDKLKATDLRYSAFNAAGASLIIISLLINWNLSAFIVEAFWLLISLYGIIKRFRSSTSTPG